MDTSFTTQICGIALMCFLGINAQITVARFSALDSCRRDEHLSKEAFITSPMRSFFDCSQSCAVNFRCGSFNSCPSADGKVLCEMFDFRANGGCGGLSYKKGCKYREKENWNLCQNGGTLMTSETNPCKCPIEWAGKYCERLYKDCKEAKARGHPISMTKGWLTIHPLGHPSSFKVYCTEGQTILLHRSKRSAHKCNRFNPKGNIDYFKKTHGNPVTCDYFLGLEKLRAILRQGDYILETFLQYHFEGMQHAVSLRATYSHFTIGNEHSGFALNYKSYKDEVVPLSQNPNSRIGTDLFANDLPRRFCTAEDANCACAVIKGASWWYGTDCNSEFPLTALCPEDLKHLIEGDISNMSLATMGFYRNYYYNNILPP